jgi:hypothetical protein
METYHNRQMLSTDCTLLETTPDNMGSFHVLEMIGGEKHSSSTMSSSSPRVCAYGWYNIGSGEPMQENADITEAMDDDNTCTMRESSPSP